MRRFDLGFAVMVLVPLLAGCVMPGEGIEAHVFILTYTLRDMTDGSEGRLANPGEHCETARVKSNHIEISQYAWDAIGRPAQLVVVDPSLQGNWVTTGHEAFPLALPAAVSPRVAAADDEPIVTLEWRSDNAGNEGLWIDGQDIALPFAFTYNSFDQSWDAVSVIKRGPSEVRIFQAAGCA